MSVQPPSSLFHRFNDAVLIESFTGLVLEANVKACEVYGYQREELVGLAVSELVPEEERWKMAQVEEKINAGAPFLLQGMNCRKNGEIFPAEISGAELEYEGQRAMVIVVRDITAHKQLEEKLRDTLAHLERTIEERTRDLRASEERYRYLYEQASDILFETDMEGRFVSVNQTAAVLSGYRREEILGRHFSDFANHRDLGAMEQRHRQVLRGAAMSQALEVQMYKKDGSEVLVEYKISPRYIDGRIVGVHGVARDITEKRRAEQQNRETEQLVTLGKLVTSIAHEIRNPLFGISSIAQILSTQVHSAGNRELFEAMMSEIQRLNRLISELLQFGRPRPLKLETVSLPALFEELLRLAGPALKSKKLRIETEWNGVETACSDRTLLRQILTNLLLNATDFSPAGQVIRLVVRRTSEPALPARWQLGVHNFGDPIPPQDKERVFELFYSTREGGTGLGLSVCRQLVGRLGGTIELQSSRAQGTWFWVTLPLDPGADPDNSGE